jgi:hypothetical protein
VEYKYIEMRLTRNLEEFDKSKAKRDVAGKIIWKHWMKYKNSRKKKPVKKEDK